MNRKKILQIVATLGLLGAGIYFSYFTFNTPIETKEIKDSPFSVLLKNDKETFLEEEEWYDTKIEYPKNNTQVRNMIFERYQAFVKETEIKKYKNIEDAKAGLMINVEGLKYTYIAEYKIATGTDSISYIYQIYTFTGGAHGGTEVFPVVFNDKLEIVPIDKILPETTLVKVSALCEADLKKQKRERLKSYGSMSDAEINEYVKNDDFLAEGVKPTRDNYSTAWYEGDMVVISFGQYQVGPYAEGIYEVRVSKEEVRP
jgi:hypothetical protein